jgi:predicted molibdopterin-dependent oxidoreductase YjgC
MSSATSSVVLQVNGRAVTVTQGVTVAAALALAAMPITRSSVSGQARAPLCGMGICQECRVRVNGHVRLACQTLCAAGMQVERLP